MGLQWGLHWVAMDCFVPVTNGVGETQSNTPSSGLLWWWISGRRDEETRIKWGLLNVTLETEREKESGFIIQETREKGKRFWIWKMGIAEELVTSPETGTRRETWLVVRVISVREQMFFASADNIQTERFGWWREKWMERCHELYRWGHLLTLVHPLSFCWLNSHVLLLPALLQAK